MATRNMIVKAPKTTALDPEPQVYTFSPYSRFEAASNEGIAWRKAVRILQRHWKLAVVFALAVELSFALLVWFLHDTYQARAALEIAPPSPDSVSLGSPTAAIPSPQDYVDTQVEILKGDGIALDVIGQLELQKNPAFLERTWFQKTKAAVFGWLPGREEGGEKTETDRLLKIFKGGLTVGQVKNSRLVEVVYESRDPQLAASIAGTMVANYLEQSHRSKYEATLSAAKALSPELKELRESVEAANQRLLQFQKNNEGVELASPATTDEGLGLATGSTVATRVAELNQQLTAAIGEKLQQESYVKLIRQGQTDALPQMKDSPIIHGLTARLVDSRAELAESLAIRGSNHPEVRKLQQQTDELKKQLDAERTRIAEQLRSAYRSAVDRELLIRRTLSGLKGKLDEANANSLRYDTLRREAKANSDLYITLSSRIKELAMSGSISSNNIRVLEQPRVPQKPSGPARLQILGAGLLFGLVGGVALAFLAEGLDDKISSLDDLRCWSGLPALALVPQVASPANRRLLTGKRTSQLHGQHLTALRASGLRFFGEIPNSPEAEAIRNLETAIRLPAISGERPVQTLLITSAFPSEGKTTVAVNLAMALARESKVCLVDADFRHPVISSAFGLALRPGLRDLLVRPEMIPQIAKPLPEMPNLTVVGTGTRGTNTPDFLTSKLMRYLVEELRKNFEYIVMDSPPIIPFSEARWLAALSDGSVLVARCNNTTRRALMWSVEIFEELQAPLLGVVLNGIDLQQEYTSYGGYGYAYPYGTQH